jgi:hypothetical protein
MDTAIKFLVLTTVTAVIAFAIIREGINYLEYPSLQILSFPEDTCELILYHRGIADRRATLFIRDIDHRATPQRIANLNYDADKRSSSRSEKSKMPLFGTLSWTSDRTALVATTRADRSQLAPVPLWVFDTGSRTLYETGQFLQGQQLGKEHLEKLVSLKGYIGAPIVQWYELGKKDNYVFSWKATHWNRLAGTDSGFLNIQKLQPPSTDPPLQSQTSEPSIP